MVSKDSSTAKAVAIVSKPGKPELATVVPQLLQWFREHQYKVVVDEETKLHAPGIEVVPREQLASRPLNFVVVLGGDGTLLSAARAVSKAGIPVLGVNLGSLGFLTEVPLDQLYPTLEGIENSCCNVETRSMVHGEVVRKGTVVSSYDALNDIVVGKGTISRLNSCDVYVDGEFVSAYKADSLIVSTPTGSTAYSLSAGGPIVMPTVNAFIVTPVSAHALTHRPLVVPDTSNIELVVNTGNEEAYLSVDGQVGMPMYDGDRVRCRKSEHQVKLLRVQGTFFDVLRAKLKWGQR
ncbi:putative inorganic polyphosphate/ATP-NAD kinase [Candidatus Sulfotelmatobacter sp. SbA7]|jgi:NAD+ kinase|nr:putative inorganic polyphosphate/ATP-NAD kinase [Candidatus Sulfotelmatobacter sp. SbA7]